jgi:hypothetical protein
VEDQSAPIPEEITSEFGRIIEMGDGRSMLAEKNSPAAQLFENTSRKWY